MTRTVVIDGRKVTVETISRERFKLLAAGWCEPRDVPKVKQAKKASPAPARKAD